MATATKPTATKPTATKSRTASAAATKPSATSPKPGSKLSAPKPRTIASPPKPSTPRPSGARPKSPKPSPTRPSPTRPSPAPAVAETHPIQVLRDHAIALEAAITAAITKPKKPAVHALRIQTRRLEAQLALLTQLSALPADSPEAETLTRRLGKVRRAAGRVRDLDVQREMLKEDPLLPPKAAAELRASLKLIRKRKAAKLQRALASYLPKVAAAAELMIQSVATANGLTLPDVRLVAAIEKWTNAQTGPAKNPEAMSDDALHTARKAAKTARYMADNTPGSDAVNRTAARYERLQDAGGRWHDWLDLTAASRHHFGAKHPLTVTAAEHCESAKAEYRDLLR
jgi:CHAD domain-containing protein